MSTRAASTTLGFVLTFSITTILISGIMVGAGSFVASEHERVTEAELEVVGQRLASNIEFVDRVASPSSDETTRTVRTRLELPNQVAGTSYRINIEPIDSDTNKIVLRSAAPEVTVQVTVKTSVSLASGWVDAGDVTVTYTGSGIEVDNV